MPIGLLTWSITAASPRTTISKAKPRICRCGGCFWRGQLSAQAMDLGLAKVPWFAPATPLAGHRSTFACLRSRRRKARASMDIQHPGLCRHRDDLKLLLSSVRRTPSAPPFRRLPAEASMDVARTADPATLSTACVPSGTPPLSHGAKPQSASTRRAPRALSAEPGRSPAPYAVASSEANADRVAVIGQVLVLFDLAAKFSPPVKSTLYRRT